MLLANRNRPDMALRGGSFAKHLAHWQLQIRMRLASPLLYM